MRGGGSFRSLALREAGRSMVYTAATASTQLGNLLIQPFIWRVLTPADYGVIAVADIAALILGGLFCFSLEQGVSRFYYEWDASERKRRLGQIWLAACLSSVAVGLLGFSVFGAFGSMLFKGVAFFPYVAYSVLIAFFSSFGIIPVVVIRMRQEVAKYAAIRLLGMPIQAGLQLLLVLWLGRGLVGYFHANLLYSAVMAVVYSVLMLSYCAPTWGLRMRDEVMRYSLPLVPASVVAGLLGSVDRALLQRFIALEDVGLYSIALRFAGIITIVAGAIKLSSVPFIMKNIGMDQGERTVRRMIGFYMAALFLCGIVVSALADNYVQIAGQRAYQPVIRYIPWLVVISVFDALAVYFSINISLSKKSVFVLLVFAGKFLVTVLLGVILVPTLGIKGMLAARGASTVSYLVATILIGTRLYHLSYDWLRLGGLTAAFLAGIVVAGLASQLLGRLEMICSFGVVASFAAGAFFFLRGEGRSRQPVTERKGERT